MIRFEIDPTLVADAIREGRKLVVEVYETRGGVWKKVMLGGHSPHAQTVALAKRMEQHG